MGATWFNRRWNAWAVLCCLGAALWAAPARLQSELADRLDTDLRKVSVDVSLLHDGHALVRYQMLWRVSIGTMGGFYFAGEPGGRMTSHPPGTHAIVAGDVAHQLDLIYLGHKWDVLLAHKQRFGPGEITYSVSYFTDYQASGHVQLLASSESGPVVVFDWTPALWEEDIEEAQVAIRWPVVTDDTSPEALRAIGMTIAPETRWENTITYEARSEAIPDAPRQYGPTEKRLVVVARREGLVRREPMRLRFTMPARNIVGLTLPTRRASVERGAINYKLVSSSTTTDR